jgi:drug/metabolite transporter (DMT)-like permease
LSAWLRALAAVAVWGASFVAIKVALEGFTPLGLVAARMLLGAALLGSIQKLRGGALLPSAKSRPRVLALGVILAVHMALQAVGLLTTTAVNTGWIIAAIPAAIAVGAHAVLGQRMAAAGWLGVVVASGGVLLVVGASPSDLADARFGDALQAISCLTWAAYTLAAGPAIARDGALRVSLATTATAGLLCLPVALITGPFHTTPTLDVVVAFLFLAVFCSAMAYLFWYQALEVLGPIRTGATLYTEPFFTLAASALVIGEAGTGATLLAGLVVLTGVWLVQRGSRRQPT